MPSARVLAVTLALTFGCEVPLPDQQVSGQWVDYRHWPEEPPCREAIDHLDGLVNFVCSEFSIRPANRAFTHGWSHDHEAVHAILSPVGSPPRLFQEGVAMVYGCGTGGGAAVPVDSSTELERLLSSEAWLEEYPTQGIHNYVAAGSFVRYLLDTWGQRRFVDLYARAPHDGGPWTPVRRPNSTRTPLGKSASR